MEYVDFKGKKTEERKERKREKKIYSVPATKNSGKVSVDHGSYWDHLQCSQYQD